MAVPMAVERAVPEGVSVGGGVAALAAALAAAALAVGALEVGGGGGVHRAQPRDEHDAELRVDGRHHLRPDDAVAARRQLHLVHLLSPAVVGARRRRRRRMSSRRA